MRKNPELAWARDIIAVYERQGKGVPRNASAAQRELYDWASDADNKSELFTKLVPKAIEVLAKFSKAEDEGEVVRVERKSIAQLRSVLQETLDDSKSVEV